MALREDLAGGPPWPPGDEGHITDHEAIARRLNAMGLAAAFWNDFGLDGDGTTNNDAAFADALDSLNGAPGRIILPPGDTGRESVYGVQSPITLLPYQGIWSPQAGYQSLGPTIKALSGFSGDYVVGSDPDDGSDGGRYWHGGLIENVLIDCNDGLVDHGLWLHNMGEESMVRRVSVQQAAVASYMLTGVHAVGSFEAVSAWTRQADAYGVKCTVHPDYPLDGDGNRNAGGVLRFYGLSGDNGTVGDVGDAAAHLFVDGDHTITVAGLKSELFPRVVEVAENSNARIWLTGDAIRPSPAAGEVVKILDTAHPTVVITAMRANQYDNIIDDAVTGTIVPAPTQGPHVDHMVYAGNPTNNVSHDVRSQIVQSNDDAKQALRARRHSATQSAVIFQVENESGTALARIDKDGAVVLNNGLAYVVKETGGSDRRLVYMSGSNTVHIGDVDNLISGGTVVVNANGELHLRSNATDVAVIKSDGLHIGGNTGPLLKSGTGSPESVVTAPVGSIFLRSNGGAGTSIYVKESGAGNTGWVGK